jgi:hypothetical protein
MEKLDKARRVSGSVVAHQLGPVSVPYKVLVTDRFMKRFQILEESGGFNRLD